MTTHNNEIIGSEYIKLAAELKGFPIEFRLRDNKDYVDLTESLLRLKVKVSNADGSAIAEKAGAKADGADQMVALTNNAIIRYSVMCKIS